VLSIVATRVVQNISEKGFDVNQLNKYWTDASAFIFMAAIIVIIDTIFKRGIELQSENELTV
jgi:preprotein translocase subunit SecF